MAVLLIINTELKAKRSMQKEDAAENDIRLHKVKEGFLIKRSRILKEWKKRWMVLTRTHLYSFENKGQYRNPTEKIPLKEVSTIKSYYKNQYERPHVFRIESDDTYFYLSSQDHQQKWAWMTAIEKMTEQIFNPSEKDSQNVIRETLRMSTALRQSTMGFAARRTTNMRMSTDPQLDIMKQIRLSLASSVVDEHYLGYLNKVARLGYEQLENICFQGECPQIQTISHPPITERIVERIVEIRVPVEKVIQIERVITVRQPPPQIIGGSLSELFAELINSKLEDPKPMLDFVAFLGMSGFDKYQYIALQFCCEPNCQRFFSELLLQVLNEQVAQERLNRYTGFIYMLCEREVDYFYTSDLRILIQIVLREIQLYRSQLNQIINLHLLKVLLTYHLNSLGHKRNDIFSIVGEIASIGSLQNREVAQEICMMIS